MKTARNQFSRGKVGSPSGSPTLRAFGKTMKKHKNAGKKKKANTLQKGGHFEKPTETKKSVYAEFRRWKSREKPQWHPVRKMRYVFFRMIAGTTITDALREIRWQPSEFWHLIDLKADTPFRAEYLRAKMLQGRAFADSIVTIAEGRDSVTKRNILRVHREIRRELRRAGKTKSKSAIRAILHNLMASADVNDLRALTRNKIQIESAKWLAKAVNPSEFGDKSSLAVGGAPDANGDLTPRPIQVQFVGPDGKVVKL